MRLAIAAMACGYSDAHKLASGVAPLLQRGADLMARAKAVLANPENATHLRDAAGLGLLMVPEAAEALDSSESKGHRALATTGLVGTGILLHNSLGHLR